MFYIASFGGILLTFLAGTEVDTNLLKDKFKESFLIGFGSFIMPFLCVSIITYFMIGWNLNSSLLTATALSETSIAVVYSVVVEKSLFNYNIGKLLMIATFITNMCTACALSILFTKIDAYTFLFYIVSIIILYIAYKYSYRLFNSFKFKDKINEIEIKYIFLLLLTFIFFASLGGGQAILPSFILGVLLSSHFKETSTTKQVKIRIQTVAFAVITPIFFIVGGMKVSLITIFQSVGVFLVIFIIRQIAKFIGVYIITERFIPKYKEYTTLMMSTGLTFGLVAAVFGLNNGLINSSTYSIITGVLVLSAILPSFIAQQWYLPKHSEDLTINK